MTETDQIEPLSTQTRILHVLADTTEPVAEVAKLAVIGHLRAGHQVALAAHSSILETLEVPADLVENYREIELSAKRRLSPSDPASRSPSTRSTRTSTSSTVTASTRPPSRDSASRACPRG